MVLTKVRGGNFAIVSMLALSTLIPLYDILWHKTMSSYTIKWHFFQISTKLVSSQCLSTRSKFWKHNQKESPKIEKYPKYLHDVFYQIFKNCHHAPLKSSRCIAQPKKHSSISKCSIQTHQTCLLLIFWGYQNMKITKQTIQEIIAHLSRKLLHYLV